MSFGVEKGVDLMHIVVKQHVIDQYRNKTFNKSCPSDNDIRQLTRNIILKGTRVCRRPGQNTYKVEYQNLAVVARYYKDKVVVITYLGNKKYQSWYNQQEVKKRLAVG